MASIIKQGNSWRAIIRMRGIHESRSFDKKADAQAWTAKRETEIRDTHEGRIPDIPFSDILIRYRDTVCPHRRGAKWEIVRVNQFLRQPFASMSLTKLSPVVFIAWRDARLKKVSSATARRELGFLSSICTHAVKEWRILTRNPLHEVTKPPSNAPRDRLILPDEIERILFTLGYDRDATPKTKAARVGAAFLFAIETAMRPGEIRALTWADVALDKRVARVRGEAIGGGKTAAAKRSVPLSTEAVRILKQLPQTDDPVFGLASEGVMDASFRKARDKACIEDLHFYDTRHEAITRLSKKLDVLALARAIGHRDLKQLMVYYNESAENLALRLD